MRRFSGWMFAVLMVGAVTPAVAQVDVSDPAMANMAANPNQADPNQPDPPTRVARIAVLNGTASFEPASVNEFSPAEINYPMTTGDRLYTAPGTSAEIQTGQIAVRMGEATDLTVSAMTDTLAQFGLAGGAVHLRTFGIDPGTTVELDTPNAAITVLQPGDIRVDVDPNSDLSTVTVIAGQVQINGTDFEQVVEAGTSLQLNGLNPLEVSQVGAPNADGLDSFSGGRDSEFLAAEQQDQPYVNDATVGAGDLASYGDWQPDADDGAVWYPRGVAADWQPYRVGHWAWIAPWGWTWVEAEPWGFAPFHYGRWAVIRGRWGWVPGPTVVRPVWAPALVVFVGGDGFAAGIGYRGGIAAWFPLGPREVYSPWYHASPLYLNRVNVSNLSSRDARAVRATYNARVLSPQFSGSMTAQTFAYRDRAVVVPQAAFAAGRPVASNQVRVQPGQMAAAVVLAHPMVTPSHEIVQPGPARALPVHAARPVLEARAGSPVQDGSPEQAGGNGLRGAPIVRTGAGASAPTYIVGGTGRAAQPPNVTGGRAPVPAQQPVQARQSAPPVNPPNVTRGQPPVQTQPAGRTLAPVNPPNVVRGQAPMQLQPAQPATVNTPRQLFNRATPPTPRPSFEQQREAIEKTDPGRPLSPRQMDNVRENKPAGPAQQREAAPHPAPEAHNATGDRATPPEHH
jgi:hypothetical protein